VGYPEQEKRRYRANEEASLKPKEGKTRMLRISKRLTMAAVVAAALVTIVPGPRPASAMAPCQARPLFSVIEYRQTVAVVGEYAPVGALDVQLTCGIVRNGVTVARLSESVPGPVAAIAGTADVPAGAFTVCYDAFVTFVDRPSTSTHTCP
jgi:hypothetical protein